MKKLIIAGGCFWGVEAYFLKVKGVTKTIVGYTDGEGKNPSYEEVCDASGHVEAVYIEYNENVIGLKKILKHYFNIVDPTLINRQGNDIGMQYRTALFCYDDSDIEVIKEYIESIKGNYKKPIQTEIKRAGEFYEAEAYHQKYLIKNPYGYCHIDLNKINNIEEE
jgi:peptide-methionine (S)-S-oxide reductase